MKRETTFLMSVIVIVGLLTFLVISAISLHSFLRIAVPCLTLLVIGISALFLRRCFVWYSAYMLTGKSTFNSKIDRPRVFMFSICLPILMMIIFVIKSLGGGELEALSEMLNTLLCVSQMCLFAVVLLLLYKTLGKSFESLYLPKVQELFRTYTSDFTSYASVEKLKRIFDGLIEYDFLWYEDLNEQNEMRDRFVEIFVSGNFPSEPLFHLKMNNLQTFVFHENLEKQTKGLTLNGLMQILSNKNTKATGDTITESHRKCIPENIKNRNIIELIMSK